MILPNYLINKLNNYDYLCKYYIKVPRNVLAKARYEILHLSLHNSNKFRQIFSDYNYINIFNYILNSFNIKQKYAYIITFYLYFDKNTYKHRVWNYRIDYIQYIKCIKKVYSYNMNDFFSFSMKLIFSKKMYLNNKYVNNYIKNILDLFIIEKHNNYIIDVINYYILKYTNLLYITKYNNKRFKKYFKNIVNILYHNYKYIFTNIPKYYINQTRTEYNLLDFFTIEFPIKLFNQYKRWESRYLFIYLCVFY
jgi:hypothetical protein